jgi:hypothetical protein
VVAPSTGSVSLRRHFRALAGAQSGELNIHLTNPARAAETSRG